MLLLLEHLPPEMRTWASGRMVSFGAGKPTYSAMSDILHITPSQPHHFATVTREAPPKAMSVRWCLDAHEHVSAQKYSLNKLAFRLAVLIVVCASVLTEPTVANRSILPRASLFEMSGQQGGGGDRDGGQQGQDHYTQDDLDGKLTPFFFTRAPLLTLRSCCDPGTDGRWDSTC